MLLLVSRTKIFYFFISLISAFLLLNIYISLGYYISRQHGRDAFNSNFKAFEEMLCDRPISLHVFDTQEPCSGRGIITSFHHKNLGLSMWQYANMVAGSLVTGLNAYMPDCLAKELNFVFTNISLPPLSKIAHCPVKNMSMYSLSLLEWINQEDQSIVLSWFDLYNYFVIKHLDLLKQHFRFAEGLINMVDYVLNKAADDKANVTFVGIYIQQTIQVAQQEYDDKNPSVQFFLDAANHYKQHYSNPVFLIITDYAGFWERRFKAYDAKVIDESSISQAYVLAILSHCNHSVIAKPSYTSIWGAMLTGGHAVLSFSVSDAYFEILRSNPTWIYLKHNRKSKTYNEKMVKRGR